jgi:hypothetical protein
MGTFGTSVNPAHYVEIADILNLGQVKRPTAGLVIKARVYGSGSALADITTTDYGYWTASYAGVDAIQVSGDGGSTWVGPLISAEAEVAGAEAGATADAANATATTALNTAQQALNTAQSGVSTDWTNIQNKPTTFAPSTHSHTATQVSDSTATGRALITALDAQAARAVIGAGTGNGTSNLQLGTTGTTAAPGNHGHAATGVSYTPQGNITATDVQAAIQQAAATGGSAAAAELKIVRYVSGAYESLPAAPDAAWKVVEYRGPTAPTPPGTLAYAAVQFDWLARGTA